MHETRSGQAGNPAGSASADPGHLAAIRSRRPPSRNDAASQNSRRKRRQERRHDTVQIEHHHERVVDATAESDEDEYEGERKLSWRNQAQ